MEFDFSFSAPRREPGPTPSDGNGPFRLLLIGDFGGRAARRALGRAPSPLMPPREIDAADLDRALGISTIELPLGQAAANAEMATFRSLEDFHPDALFRRLALFETPRQLRTSLVAPAATEAAFAAAEAWLTGRTPVQATDPSPRVESPMSADSESSASTLERLLGRPLAPASVSRGGGGPTTSEAVRAILDSAVRPHVTPDLGPRRAPLLAAIDEALTADMRAVLAAPFFRALEEAWRGVERLVRALDTDTELRISLFDAGKDDLLEALGPPGTGLEASALHRLLGGDDRPRWAVIAADVAFDLTIEDLRLASALGAIAARSAGVFVAGAQPSLLGCRTLAEVADPAAWQAIDEEAAGGAFWMALRESPLARFMGLTLPRVLARLPYGRKTEPIDSFPFEELPPGDAGEREHRTWSPAAFAVAQAYGAAFRARGWPLDFDGSAELEDLPAHSFLDGDGESRFMPCAEVALGERAAAAVMARGIIPVVARRDRGAVRLFNVPSIATPPLSLATPAPETPE